MRILIVHPRLDIYGGAEHLIVELCRHLTGKGVSHALLTTTIIDEIRRDLGGTEVIISENRGPDVIGELLALRRGVRRHAERFDVLNPHNYPADIAVSRAGKPCVWMCNEPELHLILGQKGLSPQYRLYCRMMFAVERFVVPRYIRHAVVSDEFNSARFERLFGISPQIVHYGIDAGFFATGDAGRAREKFGIGPGDFTVLQVGMLTPYKNQMATLHVLAELKDELQDMKVILAGHGAGSYRDEIEAYIRSAGLGGRVQLTGHVRREDVRDLFHASSVVMHPVQAQGGWLTPFEAIAAGRTVVVSEEMTASGIIRQNDIGIVTSKYADAIHGIHSDREGKEYSSKAERGRKWVSENLTWGRFGDGLIKACDRALAGP